MNSPKSTKTDHRARKRFGQNFLQDTAIIEQIVSCVAPKPTDLIVEIGPGLGALTEPLISACGSLKAIELDRDLIQRLQERYTDQQLQLFSADALQFDFSALSNSEPEKQLVRVVGNLPYNITSPLLFHLLTHRACIKDMHFMLQKEVVDRMVAPPGSRTFGRLSVMMQYYCLVELLLEVPPTAFVPAPKVQSAVIKLTPRPAAETNTVSFKWLEQAAQQAFSTRRKTLRNNFRQSLSLETLTDAGFEPGARAETLEIKDFVKLGCLLEEWSE